MSGFLASRGKIVCFGDSITQYGYDNNGGWVSLLAHHYTRKLDVINRGYSGYNTAHALFVLDKVIESYGNMNAEIVLVFFGANDANDDHIQGVPLDKYHSNLTEISQKLLAGGSRVILITPPAFDEDAYCTQRGFSECYRSNPRAKDYADAVSKIGKTLNVPVVDIWSSMVATPTWKSFLSDGLHLSKSGNEFVFQEVIKVIDSNYPELNNHSKSLKLDALVHSSLNQYDMERCWNEGDFGDW